MSKQTAWIELFSGVVIDEPDTEDRRGKLTAAVDKAAAAQAVFLRRQKAQADALAVVREKFDTIKGEVQQVMSEKIKSGPFKGKSFLDVEKGQVDEIDIEDITAEAQKSGKPPLPKDLTAKLLKHGNAVAGLGVELREARFKPDPEVDKDEPLFTNAELQAEFWTPVMRERAFPEGFIAAPWSATQQMLDQTTALYQEMVEQKKIAGELTPDRDFLKDALETGAQVLSVGAEALKGFDGKQIELAKEILETGSEVINSMGEVRDKLKNTEFTDAASVALDICGSLASAALKGAGVDSKIVDATTGAIGAGSSAILLGKTLNQVRLGEADLSQALTQMGDVLAKALTTASDGTAGATKDGLAIAAKAAPTLFKALGLGTDLPELVRNGDTKSVIDRLAEIAKDVLAQLPGLDKLGVDLGQVVDLSAAGLNLAVKTAFAVKKGEYAKAFNEVVAEVGGKLGDVLKTAGVDEGLAGQIVKLYQGASSVPQAIDALRQDPPKVHDAVNALAGGIQSALGGSGDKTLAQVGEGLAKGIGTLVAADQVRKLYTEGKYDEAVKLVASQLESGVGRLFGALGIQMPGGGSDEGGGQPDSGAMDTLKELVGKLKSVKVDPALVKEASTLMQKKKDEEQAAADVAEAEELLAQAELDLKSLSQAQRTGAEASNIEQMIADLLRDRMILKLATQIAQGGAAFLAQFLPGLGAASAGIKLAASLFAAGQRAKQLDEWIRSQSDLQNAQSALSSSAANFVKNQGQQLAHYSAQAFFAAQLSR
ncbi:hypothetical protein, partial [Pelomonas sp. KK5]|uniref:hypothetical protein n=1 Tax=Pelomonas sp. KK5 TaxID=1855730 RepID=UPI00117E3DE8